MKNNLLTIFTKNRKMFNWSTKIFLEEYLSAMRMPSFSYKSFFLFQNIHWECKYFWVGEMEDNLLNWYLFKNILGTKVELEEIVLNAWLLKGAGGCWSEKNSLKSCLALLMGEGKNAECVILPYNKGPGRYWGRDAAPGHFEW